MRKDSGKFIKDFRSRQDILFVRAGQEVLITDTDTAHPVDSTGPISKPEIDAVLTKST